MLGGLRRAPAAAAALETALLDAWCRLFDRPLRDVVRAVVPSLGHTRGLLADEPRPQPVTLVADLAKARGSVAAALTPASAAALRHVKLKASAEPADTAQ